MLPARADGDELPVRCIGSLIPLGSPAGNSAVGSHGTGVLVAARNTDELAFRRKARVEGAPTRDSGVSPESARVVGAGHKCLELLVGCVRLPFAIEAPAGGRAVNPQPARVAIASGHRLEQACGRISLAIGILAPACDRVVDAHAAGVVRADRDDAAAVDLGVQRVRWVGDGFWVGGGFWFWFWFGFWFGFWIRILGSGLDSGSGATGCDSGPNLPSGTALPQQAMV